MEKTPHIKNSTLDDLSSIFDLYQTATQLMIAKKQVPWPSFERELIINEINEKRQWKLLINGEIACIWATTLQDEDIWGTANQEPAVYIHRIATHPNYKGQRLVRQIVQWANQYCLDHQLQFVRLDTVGLNKGLINHYLKMGFTFLGTKKLENTQDLPKHYSKGPVCLFQRSPMDSLSINYNNRRFKPIQNTENGETSQETIFNYKQDGNIITANYQGGEIIKGQLIGLVDEDGTIDMRYHHINTNGELMTGTCISKPKFTENGKLRLQENWQWTGGDKSIGKSNLEEI